MHCLPCGEGSPGSVTKPCSMYSWRASAVKELKGGRLLNRSRTAALEGKTGFRFRALASSSLPAGIPPCFSSCLCQHKRATVAFALACPSSPLQAETALYGR